MNKIRITVIKYLLLLNVVLLFNGCVTSEDTLKKDLLKHNLILIERQGWAPLSCSEEDFFSTGFTAKNQNGLIVKGAICKGILKGSTLRLD